MSNDQRRHLNHARHSPACWVFSLVVHGLAVSAALALVSDLTIPPPQELFRWDVSVVETEAPAEPVTPAPPSVAPTPPKPQPVKTPVPKTSQPVRTEPVVRATEPMEATQSVQQAQPVQEAQQEQIVPPVQQTAPQEVASVTRPPQEILTQSPQLSRNEVPVETHETVQPLMTTTASPTVQDHTVTATPAVTEHAMIEESRAPVETPQKVEQTLTARPAPVIQQRAVQHMPIRSRPSARPDYGWLAQALWANVDERKRYPQEARRNHWEGKVILRLTIEQRGTSVYLLDLALEESSGHSVLDRHTQDMVRKAFPLEIKHALTQPQIQVHLPFSYSME